MGEKARMGLYSVGAGIQGLRDVFSPPELPEGVAYSTKPEALQKRFWDEYGRQTVEFAQVEAENVKGIKKFAGDTIQAITQMIPTILLGAAGSSAVGLGMLGMSAAGNAAQQALKEGATQEKALAYGLLIGGIEAATESIVGGLPFMKGVGDKAIEGILKPVKSNVVRALANRVIDAGGEALEEIIAGSLDPVAKRITYDKDAKFPKLSELAYEGGVGFAVSAVLGVLPTIQDVFKYKNIDEAFNAAVETVESLPDGYKSKTMPRGDKEAFVKQVQEDFTEHATRVGNGLANLIEGKTDYGLPIAPEGEIVYGEDRSGVSFKPAEQPSIEAPSQLQEIQPVPDEKETSSIITPETQETDSTALQANIHRHNIELSGVSSSNGLTVKIKFRLDRYVDDPEAIGQSLWENIT